MLQITEDVLAGRTTTAKGSVAGSLLGAAVRTFDAEKRLREFVELKQEVEELKSRFASRTLEHDSNFGSGYWAR